MGDHLGLSQAEVRLFLQKHASDPLGGVGFPEFQAGYYALNPFMITHRKNEFIIRKPGSLHGKDLKLEEIDDCEVYVCDPTAQVLADFCKRCLVLLAPCASSAFIRDCEDCVFWIAAQQLRTRSCKRCTFYLYSKTEPIIEMSEDLVFAPWCARYPGCSEHFRKNSFSPERNLWNAIFDFTGKADRSNWRIAELSSVVELSLELDEAPESSAPPDNPVQPVTHELLCAPPCASGESCGEGIANIPQTRPALPPSPKAGADVRKLSVIDEWSSSHAVGLERLDALRP
jgi:hypothetical protein